MDNDSKVKGWGVVDSGGFEIWDSSPVFWRGKCGIKEKTKLLFYPKKFFLYRYLWKNLNKKEKDGHIRVLDVGCGTGESLIDLKSIFRKDSAIFGMDVVRLQIDLAGKKLKAFNQNCSLRWYDGKNFPFTDNYFDGIYTSDVLGHVEDVDAWLAEISRVLKPGGVLAMFSESKLGKHAFVRNYLMKRGVNVDPHAKFHISSYSKKELKEKIEKAGFEVEQMFSAFWASFLVHPQEFFVVLSKQKKFWFLRKINFILCKIREKTNPVFMALAEIWGLLEMLLIGKFVESQGYVILAKKK